jgi:hypothetical protein
MSAIAYLYRLHKNDRLMLVQILPPSEQITVVPAAGVAVRFLPALDLSRRPTNRDASICDRPNNFIRSMPGEHHSPHLHRDREPLPRNQPFLRYTLHKETILYEQQNSYQRR